MRTRPGHVFIALFVILLLFEGVTVAPLFGDGGTSIARNHDVNDGRIIHYTFDGNDTNHIQNKQNSRYDGVVSGNVMSISRGDGHALLFDGLPDRVTINESDSIPLKNSFSISFWIRLDGTQKGNVLGEYGSAYFFIDGRRLTFVAMNGSEKLAQPTAEVPMNEWVHVLGTYHPQRGARLFVNGELKSTKYLDERPGSPTTEMVINLGWHQGFNGSIDSFSLWNRALPNPEVKMVNNGRERATVLSPELQTGITVLLLLILCGAIWKRGVDSRE